MTIFYEKSLKRPILKEKIIYIFTYTYAYVCVYIRKKIPTFKKNNFLIFIKEKNILFLIYKII